jgi:hypothetical protein
MLSIPISDQLLPFIEEQATRAGFSTIGDHIQDLILREQQRLASTDSTSIDPVELMRLPLEERQKALEIQASAMIQHYEQDKEWREFTAGDIVEFK